MVADAYVNHIPVLTGGVGREELREFYSKRFIPQMPPDTEMTPISRTIGNDQLVDEMVFKSHPHHQHGLNAARCCPDGKTGGDTAGCDCTVS